MAISKTTAKKVTKKTAKKADSTAEPKVKTVKKTANLLTRCEAVKIANSRGLLKGLSDCAKLPKTKAAQIKRIATAAGIKGDIKKVVDTLKKTVCSTKPKAKKAAAA